MECQIPLVCLSFILLIFSSGSSANSQKDIKFWCQKTPYPITCRHFISKANPIKDKAQFFKASVQSALEQTILYAKDSTTKSGSEASWIDCSELYQDAINTLNQTLSNSKWTNSKKQLWLSAALTYLKTCETEFIELGIVPIISNITYELIMNSLSINKVLKSEPSCKNIWHPSSIKLNHRRLLESRFLTSAADIVVAKDGSGDYKTINEAIKAASKRSGTKRLVIYVKTGSYHEYIRIKMKNIVMLGDGIGSTIITGKHTQKTYNSTWKSATFSVSGDGFFAQDITFRNTAGAKKAQAVALHSTAHDSVFYRCSIEGFQDTLYVHSHRQFYRECSIYGTVDFICGNGQVVLQDCDIYARYTPTKTNTITSSRRIVPSETTGISIHNCRVYAAPDLKKVQSKVKTYLGRPWGPSSRTVVMNTFLDDLIHPDGWLMWGSEPLHDTLYYGEYNNTGPGSSTARRVRWKGYHVITNTSEASQFTVKNFIQGNDWLPNTDVPFNPGL